MKTIILIHYKGKIKKVIELREGNIMDVSKKFNCNNKNFIECIKKNIKTYYKCNIQYLGWIDERFEENLNIDFFKRIDNLPIALMSYNPYIEDLFYKKIGYVAFNANEIKVPKNIKFPTWLLSDIIGLIPFSIIKSINLEKCKTKNFLYFILSIAYQVKNKGVLVYSEPQLLQQPITLPLKRTSEKFLFRFVRHHFGIKWSIFLFYSFIFFEKKIPITSLINGLLSKPSSLNAFSVPLINLQRIKSFHTTSLPQIDVLIPTLNRPQYIKKILEQLADQTHLPHKVIIIEQLPSEQTKSLLPFLKNHSFPYKLQHIILNTIGVNKARNIGLKEVESEYVFLADDDIEIHPNFLEEGLFKIKNLNQKAVTFGVYRPGENMPSGSPFQWHGFGSGCSIIESSLLKTIKFDERYEHGFGEDADFGMQIRYLGEDVIYSPTPNILHLKAPSGGFRFKRNVIWENAKIIPKPSPTIMLFKLKYNTQEQILGYKLFLFLNFLKSNLKQGKLNILRYLKDFRKKWEMSIYYALKLLNK